MSNVLNLCDGAVVLNSVRSIRTALFLSIVFAPISFASAQGTLSNGGQPASKMIAPELLTAAEANVDGQRSLAIFLQAADQGSAAAKFDLGLFYQHSSHVQALQWFEAAYIGGETRAASYIGDFYLDSSNEKPNPAEARFWYEKSEKAHNIRGTIALANLYCNGTGTPLNPARCGHLADEAAAFHKPSDPDEIAKSLAQLEVSLGDRYHNGQGLARNNIVAASWYAKAVKLGSTTGSLDQAMLYVEKGGLPQNLPQATLLVDALAKAEKQHNNLDAMRLTGKAYATIGAAYEARGASGFTAAQASYLKAAAIYNPNPLVALAMRYANGKGVPVDLAHAAAIIDAMVKAQQDADTFSATDKTAAIDTYIAIGKLYEAQSSAGLDAAAAIYTQLADTFGERAPLIALAQRYIHGTGVPVDADHAYTLLHPLIISDMSTPENDIFRQALKDLAALYLQGSPPNTDRANELGQVSTYLIMPPPVKQFAFVEADDAVALPSTAQVERYPNLSAPDTVQTAQEFSVSVSLNPFQIDQNTQILSGQQDNGKLQFTLPEGMTTMPIQVDLIAPGMTFVDGTNTATLTLDSTQANSLPATFHLRSGSKPTSGMLIANLSYHQNAIAQLARPIAVVVATATTVPTDSTPAPQPPIVTLSPPNPDVPTTAGNNSGAITRADNAPINNTQPHALKLESVPPVKPPAPNPPIVHLTSPVPPAPTPKLAPIVLDPNAKFADLTIHETAVGDTMYYTFDSPGLTGTVYDTTPGVAGLKAKVQQIYNQLQVEGERLGGGVGAACAADRAKGGGNDKDDNCQESVLARALVQGIGTNLYQQLAPAQFRSVYQLLALNHIRISSITVVTNNPTLPWELMLPVAGTDQFLGLTTAVVRENASAPQLAQPAQVDFSGISVVAPEYSGSLALNTAAEVSAIKTNFPQLKQVDGLENPVGTMIRNAPQGIVHFAGHGKRDAPTATTAASTSAAPSPSSADNLAPQTAIALEDYDMTPDTFAALRAQGPPSHPFYFLNACDLGQSDKELNYIDGWASSLMNSGASGYLGALFEVGDDSATQFATQFYTGLKKNLASNTAWSIADLVTSSRKATYLQANDPTALAYVLYAKQFMKLVPAQ